MKGKKLRLEQIMNEQMLQEKVFGEICMIASRRKDKNIQFNAAIIDYVEMTSTSYAKNFYFVKMSMSYKISTFASHVSILPLP